MQIAVRGWIINPELEWKFVKVSGIDSEGDFIDIEGRVVGASGETLKVATTEKEYEFYIGEFGQNGLKLEVWDQSTKCEMPEDCDQTLVD